MDDIKQHKVTALPSPLEPNSVYYVKPTGSPDGYLEIYVTNGDATAAASTLTADQIQDMIDASAGGGGTNTRFVDTIADRDALVGSVGNAQRVYVEDASDDPTVEAGGAEYIWRASANSWRKLWEDESQDLVLSWDKLLGRPAATAADIDAAVAARHGHNNMTQLNQIGQDGQGNLTYGGVRPKPEWATVNW